MPPARRQSTHQPAPVDSGAEALPASPRPALLAVTPAYRGNVLAPWLLIAEAWRYGKEQNLLKVWGEVPVANLPAYNRIGWPWKKIGPARLHWGEPCYPCMIDLDELENIVIRRAKTSALHKEVLASMYR